MLTFEQHPPNMSAKLPASGAIAAIISQVDVSGCNEVKLMAQGLGRTESLRESEESS